MSNYLETFSGSVVQWVIHEMRKFDHAATAYENLSEEARQEMLNGLVERADKLTQQLVEEVQTQGLKKIEGVVKQVTFKQNAETVITSSKADAHIGELARKGGNVHILLPQLALDLDAPETDDMFDEVDEAEETVWQPPGDDDDDLSAPDIQEGAELVPPPEPPPAQPEDNCICTPDENGLLTAFNPNCPMHGSIGGRQDDRPFDD